MEEGGGMEVGEWRRVGDGGRGWGMEVGEWRRVGMEVGE